MSNLNNVYGNCPALMSDGRTSTDYRGHNNILPTMIGSSKNSFVFREQLQKNGYSAITDTSKYVMCTVDPAGEIKIDSNINLNIEPSGNFRDAFQPILKPGAFMASLKTAVSVATPTAAAPTTTVPVST